MEVLKDPSWFKILICFIQASSKLGEGMAGNASLITHATDALRIYQIQ